MAISPYAMCPCGSGKQFKWCCQAYFAQIEKASVQIEKGQLTAAEQTLNQLVAKYPKVPQVLGYQAELLFQQGKKPEAETIVRTALNLDPNYARGHWLMGMMRLDAQDAPTALKHLRQASELIHPNANEFLSQTLVRVAEVEMELIRPVASRVALERAAKVSPNNAELQQAFEASFNEDTRLPWPARRSYSFRLPKGDKSIRWQTGLEAVANGKLSLAAKAFKDIAIAHPDDAASQFNLGLIRAWIGENEKALESLSKCIEIDSNPEHIAEAVGLIEVVRCGAGLESECDYIEHSAMFSIRDVKELGTVLGEWEEGGRIILRKADEEGQVLAGSLLEAVPDLGTESVVQFAPIQSHVVISQQVIVFTSGRREALDKSVDELLSRCSQAVDAPQFSVSTNRIGETLEAVAVMPIRGEVTPGRMTEELRRRTREYFEIQWLNRPLKALNGTSPLEAVGQPAMKKRLPGLIAFLEECVANASKSQEQSLGGKLYNFDRLRRRLELPVTGTDSADDLEVETLNTAALVSLNLEKLTDEQLGRGFRFALKLEQPEVAARFADAAAKRETIADRYPFFNHLISVARDANQHDEVLRLLKAGAEADAATNESLRAGDYALGRGRALSRSGDAEGAATAFREAIEKSPQEIKFFSPAAEAMLGKKQGKYALEFAEKGLALARSQNNRDGEQQFLELIEAAKKLG